MRGVPIGPVGIQTPPGPATGVDASVGAGEVEAVGIGDAVAGDEVATAAADGSGTGGTTDGSRSEAGARRQRPTDEQQGCRRKQGDAAAPGGSSGNAPGLPAAIQSRRR